MAMRSHSLCSSTGAVLKSNVLRLGDVHAARLRKISPEQGGGFAELENGENVFLRRSALKGRAEGERFNVKIEAEHRRGKAPRVSITSDRPHIPDPFETWLSVTCLVREPQKLLRHLPVTNSSKLRSMKPFHRLRSCQAAAWFAFSETPALVAIDIDTAGRSDRGRSYDRALNVNLEAAEGGRASIKSPRAWRIGCYRLRCPSSQGGWEKCQARILESVSSLFNT